MTETITEEDRAVLVEIANILREGYAEGGLGDSWKEVRPLDLAERLEEIARELSVGVPTT